jgi:hypothetical protein
VNRRGGRPSAIFRAWPVSRIIVRKAEKLSPSRVLDQRALLPAIVAVVEKIANAEPLSVLSRLIFRRGAQMLSANP